MVLLQVLWVLLPVAFTPLAHAAHNVTLGDSDPRIQYSAGWVIYGDPNYLGGDTHAAYDPNTTAQLDFTGMHCLTSLSPSAFEQRAGTAIYYNGDRNSDHGYTGISLDGVETLVNTYAPTLVYQVVVFFRTGLPNTGHRLIIRQAETGRFAMALDQIVCVWQRFHFPRLQD